MANERERRFDTQMAESQIVEHQNIGVLLEEARSQTENLSEHRRRRLEVLIRAALRELDAQLRDVSRGLH
jgi:hypothetical protein